MAIIEKLTNEQVERENSGYLQLFKKKGTNKLMYLTKDGVEKVIIDQDLLDAELATLPAAPKEYHALITQSGTDAPVATIIKNTLGVVPVWSRTTPGNYQLTAAGVFTSGKTLINDNGEWIGDGQFMKTIGQGTPATSPAGYMESFVLDQDQCWIYFRSTTTSGVEMVDLVGTTALYIKVIVFD